ncbi:MAG: metallophosphoesterase [Actinomycetota bacterium]|nr:metallophosphoesterase [Actinomycetota bacterium]
MRVTAISDLHGAVEHIEPIARESDVLLVLGDLINVLDYRTMDGILVEVFGREPVAEAADLRSKGKFDEARTAIRRSTAPDFDFRARFLELAKRQYEHVFEALPDQTYVTFGNVDVPDLLRASVPEGVRFVDGESVRIGGTTFGFVGGGVQTPLGVPGEVSDAEYEAKFGRVGPVDVICTHMPPRIPWYTYDVVAKKFEPGSVALIEYARQHRPKYALFGHVHQPLVNRGMIHGTDFVNVGHFQATGRGFSIEVAE